ncbi:long-chain fatty acid-CoA ligase [Kappamyces sp. JEL0680]|nr:long-chain fatty acid-CoA ligase [Kappamyces sp. JEL0680]
MTARSAAAASDSSSADDSSTWEMPGTADTEKGFGAIRRSKKFAPEGQALRTTPAPHVKTIHDILVLGIHKHPSNKCLGEREVVKEIEEVKEVANGSTVEKKTWKYFQLSPYKWLTYSEVYQRAVDIGAALTHLGLKSQDIINIFATTSPSWMIMAHACYSQNISISTSYDSLGEEGLAFALNEGEVSSIFTQPDLFSMIKKVAPKVPTLKLVFYNAGKNNEEAIEKIKSELTHLTFYSLDELQAMGATKPVPLRPPLSEDLCCIMYTSGSTGNPKGVMLTHGNILASVSASQVNVGSAIEPSDVYLAYLPLAHVLEFVVENYALLMGCGLGYGHPRTLTDDSVRNCKGDIRELRPTFMAGVPTVWERIRKGIMAKLGKSSSVKQKVFWGAYNVKKALLSRGLPHLFMDRSIFKAIQSATGGRLKLALSGGAPLAAETQEFLTICICQILQGYGMVWLVRR